jgi:hypothetical protein
MFMRLVRFAAPVAVSVAALAMVASPALARGGWGGGMGGGWGMDPWSSGRTLSSYDRGRADGPVEGKVTVSRFVAETAAAKALGGGTIAAVGAPTGSGVESRELATYEAAVIDQLGQLGYKTDVAGGTAGQVVELHIGHDEVAPQEVHKPVSGEATVGVSNRGTMMGLAVAVDLSKPRGALVATRLEARIKDRATGEVLWEGRADTITREGSEKWTAGVVANKLAAALFDHFPGKPGGDFAER